MKNEIFFNNTKRKFLKILGVSLIAPVGFAFYNIRIIIKNHIGGEVF